MPDYEFDVFLSYARATNLCEPEEAGWVSDFQRRLDNILRIDCPEFKIFFDDRSIDGNHHLDDRIRSAVSGSAVMIVVLAPVYLTRPYCIKELELFGDRVAPKELCSRMFVVHHHWVPLEDRPEILKMQKGYTFYWEDQNDTRLKIPLNYVTHRESYDRAIYGLCRSIATQLKEMKRNHSAKTKTMLSSTGSAATEPLPITMDASSIDLARLPTVSGKFFGRSEEFQRINSASNTNSENVISIIARGGEGKTSLIARWLNELATQSWKGFERVFAWSFYSQGTNDRVSSADEFVAAARRFFGDEAPDEVLTPYQKGRRLAELVSTRRNLLFLDGLEPLQYPPGTMAGMIKDQSLQVFLKSLANYNNGLCVITSREPVTELQAYKSTTCPELILSPLDSDRGCEFLRSLGVKGTDAKLKEVVALLDGHALSLELIGSYISQSFDGEVDRWDTKSLPAFDDRISSHADRVLLSYENWLAGKNLSQDDRDKSTHHGSGKLGGQLLQTLRLFGLFDRPISREQIAVFASSKAVADLSDALSSVSEEEFSRILHRLCSMRLIRKIGSPNGTQPPNSSAEFFDCHPLVRSYFERSMNRYPAASIRKLHSVAYEYLLTQAPEFPTTTEANAPLFQAIRHGCLSGRYSDTLEVYCRRINHEGSHYSIFQLGQHEKVVESLRYFFATPWTIPKKNLDDDDRRLVCNQVGLALGAMAKANEAIQAFNESICIARRDGDGESAVKNLNNAAHLCSFMAKAADGLMYSEEGMGAFEGDLFFARQEGVEFVDIEWLYGFLARAHWAQACLDAGYVQIAVQGINIAEKWMRQIYTNWEHIKGGESLFFQASIILAASWTKQNSRKRNPLKYVDRLIDTTNWNSMDRSEKLHFESGQNRMSKASLILSRLQMLRESTQASSTVPNLSGYSPLHEQLEEVRLLLDDANGYMQICRNRMWQQRYSLLNLSYCRMAFRMNGKAEYLDQFDAIFDEVYSVSTTNGLSGILIDALVERSHLLYARGFKIELKQQLDDLDARIDATMQPFEPKTTPWPGGNRPKLCDHFVELKSKLQPGKKLMVGYERHRPAITRLRRFSGQ